MVEKEIKYFYKYQVYNDVVGSQIKNVQAPIFQDQVIKLTSLMLSEN